MTATFLHPFSFWHFHPGVCMKYWIDVLLNSEPILNENWKFIGGRNRINQVLLSSIAVQQLLAGSRVNDVNKHRQTALHMAAANNSATIISVLLENGIEPDAVDEKGNNGMNFMKQPWSKAYTHCWVAWALDTHLHLLVACACYFCFNHLVCHVRCLYCPLLLCSFACSSAVWSRGSCSCFTHGIVYKCRSLQCSVSRVTGIPL